MEMNSLLSKNETTIKTQHNLSSFQYPRAPLDFHYKHCTMSHKIVKKNLIIWVLSND